MQSLPVFVLCFLFLTGRIEGSTLLFRTLDALTRGVHFMQEQVANINLDAVFAVRQIQELLQTYLTFHKDEFQTVRHWLEVLRDKAKRIADQGRHHVRQNNPIYSSVVGFVMDENVKSVWYPSRPTDAQFRENRVSCSNSRGNLNETVSDLCFSELGRKDDNKHCNISPSCMEMNSIRYQRDYFLTHQMLFWREMELRQCVDKVPEDLQQRFCSNMLRDAEWIASAGFPASHRDLFMEQSLCGFWGFNDFNKIDWLERILDWQQTSGCYTSLSFYYCSDNLQPNLPERVKRRERLLQDRCLSHKTSVALLALVVSLRFEAEKAFIEMDKSKNELNKLLS